MAAQSNAQGSENENRANRASRVCEEPAAHERVRQQAQCEAPAQSGGAAGG